MDKRPTRLERYGTFSFSNRLVWPIIKVGTSNLLEELWL